jgi:hypothetical protein
LTIRTVGGMIALRLSHCSQVGCLAFQTYLETVGYDTYHRHRDCHHDY